MKNKTKQIKAVIENWRIFKTGKIVVNGLGTSVISFSVVATLLLAANDSVAADILPTNGNFVSGAGTIDTVGADMSINHTGNAIIDWDTFSVGDLNTVDFFNGLGATLNKVITSVPSEIYGKINSTGDVWLVNESGVLVGSTGEINVGGTFLASTNDINNSDFLDGGQNSFSGNGSTSIVNEGSITSVSGDVILVSSGAISNGSSATINADSGNVIVGGGEQVLIKESGTLATVEVDSSASVLYNSGNITGGNVEIAIGDNNIFQYAINNTGTIKATSLFGENGMLKLTSNGSSYVGGELASDGDLSASSNDGSILAAGNAVVKTGGSANLSAQGSIKTVNNTNLTVSSSDTTLTATTGDIRVKNSISEYTVGGTTNNLTFTSGGETNYQSFVDGDVQINSGNAGTNTTIFSSVFSSAGNKNDIIIAGDVTAGGNSIYVTNTGEILTTNSAMAAAGSNLVMSGAAGVDADVSSNNVIVSSARGDIDVTIVDSSTIDANNPITVTTNSLTGDTTITNTAHAASLNLGNNFAAAGSVTVDNTAGGGDVNLNGTNTAGVDYNIVNDGAINVNANSVITASNDINITSTDSAVNVGSDISADNSINISGSTGVNIDANIDVNDGVANIVSANGDLTTTDNGIVSGYTVNLTASGNITGTDGVRDVFNVDSPNIVATSTNSGDINIGNIAGGTTTSPDNSVQISTANGNATYTQTTDQTINVADGTNANNGTLTIGDDQNQADINTGNVSGDNGVILTSQNNVNVNGSITGASGDISITAGANGGSGDVNVNADIGVNNFPDGSDVSITANNGSILTDGVNAIISGDNVSLTATNDITANDGGSAYVNTNSLTVDSSSGNVDIFAQNGNVTATGNNDPVSVNITAGGDATYYQNTGQDINVVNGTTVGGVLDIANGVVGGDININGTVIGIDGVNLTANNGSLYTSSDNDGIVITDGTANLVANGNITDSNGDDSFQISSNNIDAANVGDVTNSGVDNNFGDINLSNVISPVSSIGYDGDSATITNISINNTNGSVSFSQEGNAQANIGQMSSTGAVNIAISGVNISAQDAVDSCDENPNTASCSENEESGGEISESALVVEGTNLSPENALASSNSLSELGNQFFYRSKDYIGAGFNTLSKLAGNILNLPANIFNLTDNSSN